MFLGRVSEAPVVDVDTVVDTVMPVVALFVLHVVELLFAIPTGFPCA